MTAEQEPKSERPNPIPLPFLDAQRGVAIANPELTANLALLTAGDLPAIGFKNLFDPSELDFRFTLIPYNFRRNRQLYSSMRNIVDVLGEHLGARGIKFSSLTLKSKSRIDDKGKINDEKHHVDISGKLLDEAILFRFHMTTCGASRNTFDLVKNDGASKTQYAFTEGPGDASLFISQGRVGGLSSTPHLFETAKMPRRFMVGEITFLYT